MAIRNTTEFHLNDLRAVANKFLEFHKKKIPRNVKILRLSHSLYNALKKLEDRPG